MANKKTSCLMKKNALETARKWRRQGYRVTVQRVRSYGNHRYKYTVYAYRK